MNEMKRAILAALAALPAQVTWGYPRNELPLPILAVENEAGGVLAQADGEAYLEEYTAEADIYARTPEEREDLADQADQALSALGLRRVFQADLFDEDAYAWRKRLKYRAVLRGGEIYQG